MKVTHILPLVAVSSALVLPPDDQIRAVEYEEQRSPWYETLLSEGSRGLADAKDTLKHYIQDLTDTADDAWERLSEDSRGAFDRAFDRAFDEANHFSESAKNAWEQLSEESRNAVDVAFDTAADEATQFSDSVSDAASDVYSWLDSVWQDIQEDVNAELEDDDDCPDKLASFRLDGHPEPHHDDPHHGHPESHHDESHHDEPHHDDPHHGHPESHHDEPHHDDPHHGHPESHHDESHHDEPHHDDPHHGHPESHHDASHHDESHHDESHHNDPHHGHHESHHDDPHHDHPHHPPHHGKPHHPHHKPNETLYELIAGSKYTTKLAKLVKKYPLVLQTLNDTKVNHTLFAPSDKAFEKIPEKLFNKLSEKQVGELLSYHLVPGLYPAGRVLFTHTAPTYLKSESLGTEPKPQRLSFKKGLRGITVNFYSRIVAVDIFGTNGVIHAVDTPLFPPIGAIREIDLFPGTFSTLELGLAKTDLLDELNSTDHAGGTLFAPNNWAFQKLGPRINAFLFSPAGTKYLKALLQYHVVPENTLYTDAFYKPGKSDGDESETTREIHVDLPTALKDRSIAVDIARYGPVTIMKVNGFNTVAVSDVVAEDGVIHVMSSVIIPPKKAGASDRAEEEELSVEELVERLDAYMSESRKSDL